MADEVDAQLRLPGCVRLNSLAWKIPGGSGYVNIPDLAVVSPGFTRVGAWNLEPPPLHVFEVASPPTRAVDRGRKLVDYRLGAAGLYLLVDLPRLSPVNEVTFEAHNFATGQFTTPTARIELITDGRPLLLDLSRLVAGGSD